MHKKHILSRQSSIQIPWGHVVCPSGRLRCQLDADHAPSLGSRLVVGSLQNKIERRRHTVLQRAGKETTHGSVPAYKREGKE